MAKKVLKKKVQRKSAAQSAAAPVMESAREIWLAGLGAFNIAQQEGSRILEEGSKIFDKLVAEGSRMEARTRKDVEGAMNELRGEVENRMGAVRQQAETVRRQAVDNWDRLEKIFEDRVARSLGRLGIPSREDVNGLADRVRVLSRQVAELTEKTAHAGGARAKGGKTTKKTAAKRGRKPTAKAAHAASAAR